MKINKLFIIAPCFVFLIMHILWGKWLISVLGFKLEMLLDCISFLALIATFFMGKNEIKIPKKSALNYSLGFLSLMLTLLLVIHFIHFPLDSSIPSIIAYIFFISIGMVIGSYWAMRFASKEKDSK